MSITKNVSLGALCAFLMGSTQAYALDVLKFGIGATAIGGYNWNSPRPGSLLPEYGGLRLGYGASLDVRFLGIVGLEVDVIQSTDTGSAEISSFGENKVSIGQSAWHLPVLLKVTIPLPLIHPVILAGIDWVYPDACSVKGGNENALCAVNPYSTWNVGVGSEIRVPLPFMDLRIPISLRYAFLRETSGVSAGDVPRSEWSGDLYGTAGVSFYF